MTVLISPLPETATPPAPDGGLGALSTDQGNLPLDSVDVQADITGLAARIRLVQGFRNPFDVPLEATYVFPLPDRAAVTALRMEAADRTVDGVLKERGQARQDYDAAIAAGRRAAIAEEDRPDVFGMRVGNILPGERVTITLTLTQPLPYETGDAGGAATFRFPLVVAPRYIPGAPLPGEQAGPGTAADTDAVPDASRISPPVLLPGFPNPVRLSVTVDVDPAGLPLTEIRSALHVVTEERAGDRVTVRLQPGERLNRDFLLRLVHAPHETSALSLVPDETGEEGTFSLTVLPAGEQRPRPRDVVLVLDRSGSMQGWKMVAARRAAARIADTLTGDDRFAVLSFDHVVERPRDLPAGLHPGTDRNRFRAVEHLAAVDARGGTEMLAPLAEAASLLTDAGRDRVLVLITDGQVGNEDQLLAELAPRLGGVRVHTVGIDRAVNAAFLRRLAGGGSCELVESEDRLDEAMEGVHRRIGAPLATGLSLHADGLRVDPETVAPRRLGSLFPGVPLVITGRYRGAPAGTLTVRGTTPSGTPWEQRAAAATAGNPALTALWARAHLRDLEDRYTVSGGDDLEKRIIDTSLRFSTLCRFTAFVAVDERTVTDGGAPHQVVQPVELPDGWAAPAAPMAAPMIAQSAPMPAPGAPPMAAYGGAVPRPAPAGRPRMGGAARGSMRAPSGGAPDFGGGPVPAPEPASPPKPAADEPRRRLAAELERLPRVPVADRAAHLVDVVLPLLESVAPALPGSSPLAALMADLQALRHTPQTDVTTLWDRTVQVLTDVTAPPAKRAFWKRPR
ncbi:VIT domain-containing protein [Actinomadura macrotermitis]|uniref:Ca-activated chloride channel family protein n=1 Tax=Actinomadura macrotermitis TaxID=2585200 RepID=A0A7K0BXL5_9ACTN|nr:hypothetical protein [Actinomadura macrotermitis]